jgi:DNA-binding MarR family transcriptional regulator
MDDVDENRSLEGLLVQLLRAAGLSDTRPAVDDLAVSVSEALALLELRASGGATQGQVVNRLGLEKSTVSRLAAGLERKGWITRARNPGNQRYVRLALTHAGQAVATHVWSTWQERHARILAALTDTERAGLAIGLGGLVRALAAEGLLGNPTPGDHPREPGQPHG